MFDVLVRVRRPTQHFVRRLIEWMPLDRLDKIVRIIFFDFCLRKRRTILSCTRRDENVPSLIYPIGVLKCEHTFDQFIGTRTSPIEERRVRTTTVAHTFRVRHSSRSLAAVSRSSQSSDTDRCRLRTTREQVRVHPSDKHARRVAFVLVATCLPWRPWFVHVRRLKTSIFANDARRHFRCRSNALDMPMAMSRIINELTK
jgi:hypothetical protein